MFIDTPLIKIGHIEKRIDLNIIFGLAGDKEGRFMARRMEAMELEIAGRPTAQRCLLH